MISSIDLPKMGLLTEEALTVALAVLGEAFLFEPFIVYNLEERFIEVIVGLGDGDLVVVAEADDEDDEDDRDVIFAGAEDSSATLGSLDAGIMGGTTMTAVGISCENVSIPQLIKETHSFASTMLSVKNSQDSGAFSFTLLLLSRL